MQFLLRVTIMGVFAAAGIALAISVAANTPAEIKPDASAETAALTLPSGRIESPPPADPAPQPEGVRPPLAMQPPATTNSYQPHVAHYEPRIADRLDTMLQVLDQVRTSQDRVAVRQAIQPLAQNQFGPEGRESITAGQPTLADSDRDTTQVTLGSGPDLINIETGDEDVRQVLRYVSKEAGINILSSPSVSGVVSASLTNVPIEQALTALLKSTGFVYRREENIIYVGTPEELQGMAHVAEQTDTRIYRPNYVSAAELQKLLTPFISSDTGSITVSSPSEVGIASDSDTAGGDSFVGADVVMVRDYITILEEIDFIVEQVDRMPLQVAIEATILSVRLDDSDILGVDFELLRDKEHVRLTSGTPATTLATADFRDGLKVGFLDTSLFAFIEALETIGDTSVVASPRITCLNKQRAEILIGSELGYVSTTVTETAATQAVEFLEVGTHLRIRPFISSDGMIRMEVHPELSTGSVRVEAGFTLPDKDVTQVTTNIMARTGATVVIGGLIREDLSTSSTQIPVLGNLPWLGHLFRQRSEAIERREIIVLLTPRIVDESQMWQEGAAYAQQGQDRRQTFLDKMTPVGKRHHAERYARLGTSAYAAGDYNVALRYINLAIHWDPLHQGAINLRREILAAAPHLETSVNENLRYGLAPHQSPVRDYSRQGYPWRLETPAAAAPHVYIGDQLPEPVDAAR